MILAFHLRLACFLAARTSGESFSSGLEGSISESESLERLLRRRCLLRRTKPPSLDEESDPEVFESELLGDELELGELDGSDGSRRRAPARIILAT